MPQHILIHCRYLTPAMDHCHCLLGTKHWDCIRRLLWIYFGSSYNDECHNTVADDDHDDIPVVVLVDDSNPLELAEHHGCEQHLGQL